jgi:hypothetical protein
MGKKSKLFPSQGLLRAIYSQKIDQKYAKFVKKAEI